MTLVDAIPLFLQQVEANGRSPLTLDVYGREARRFARWAGGDRSIDSFRPPDLAGYLTDPRIQTRHERTNNRTRTVLRLLFGYLEDGGWLRRNPATALKNCRMDPPLPRALTDAEVQSLFAATRRLATSGAGRRDLALFTFLLDTGLRLQSALALDLEHVDSDRRSIRVAGKGHRVIRLEVPESVIQNVLRYLHGECITNGAVFRSARGSRLSRRQAHARFRQAREAAGLSGRVTVHSLRHTFACRLLKQGADLRTIRDALGHRSLITTQNYLASV